LEQCFAYVDFENDEGLQAAILKDNTKLKGSKLKVHRSDPSGTAKKGAAVGTKQNTGM
jgi:RNA recognition motif-containing protein